MNPMIPDHEDNYKANAQCVGFFLCRIRESLVKKDENVYTKEILYYDKAIKYNGFRGERNEKNIICNNDGFVCVFRGRMSGF